MSEDPSNARVASVRQRLLNGARSRGEEFQSTLLRFGAERLLYRLSQSPHADDFVLKGGMLFLIWEDQLYRPTRDVDLTGRGPSTPEDLCRVFRDVATRLCPDDALRFDPDSVTASEIREAQQYEGVRVTLNATLGTARIPLQVDIGFGDAITPPPSIASLPTLLPMEAPELRVYPLESVVAEKLEAAARFGRLNSRMKDFRDLLTLARRREFDGRLLARAVAATFARRDLEPASANDLVQPEFFTDEGLGRRWAAYRRSLPDDIDLPPGFGDVGEELRVFLEPLVAALNDGPVPGAWDPVRRDWASDS